MKKNIALPGIVIAGILLITGCRKEVLCEKFHLCEINNPQPDADKVQIIARSNYTMMLDQDHTLWGTGSNDNGSLGDGTEDDKHFLVKIMENVKSAASGWQSTFIVKTDNTLWACGYNENGNLADGTTTDRLAPVKIMDDVKAVSSGAAVSLILKNDNTVWAAGLNSNGEFGDGSSSGSLFYKKVAENVTAIASGWYHSLILKPDNTLWETNIDQRIFVKIMEDVKSVSGGYETTLILKNDNSVWGKGDNWAGQLGDGSFVNKKEPEKIMDNVKAIVSAPYHSMFLKLDNSLWMSGWNASGQFGNGTKAEYLDFTSTPVKVMEDVHSIAGGDGFSLIIKTDGSIWGAGMNNAGALGDSTNIDRLTFSPALLR
ncbi:MAG: hypothetical protein QM763_23640 [Agriterribacter sp.]